jgi:hypothetical protein
MQGDDINPNANAPLHLESTEPEVLMDAEGDWSLEEDGAGRENASVDEDEGPHVELQEPGISYLATSEEEKFLTSPPSFTTYPRCC